MQSLNVFSDEKPEGRLDVGRALGSTALTMFVYDLEPGSSSSPYHYEYEEEWLLVVEGTLVLRAADGEYTLQRGDLVRRRRLGHAGAVPIPAKRSDSQPSGPSPGPRVPMISS